MVPLRTAIGAALAAALVIAFAAIVVNGRWRQEPPGTNATGRIESIAVLPLTNLSGDPEQEYFADGMTESLIAGLARIGSLRVVSRTSVMTYKGSDAPLPEIARQLGVDAILEGSVDRSGSRVRVTAQLIDAATDRHVWVEQYDRDVGEALTLQREVARAIAREIEVTLTPQEIERLEPRRRIDPLAQEAYLKGLYYYNKESFEENLKGGAYFEEAVERDPDFALAHWGLAQYYSFLEWMGDPKDEVYPKARAEVLRALELDDTLAEAHAFLAHLDYHYLWEHDGVREGFERAIELNPSSVYARRAYSWYLMQIGETEQAMAQSRLVVELNPLDLAAKVNAAADYFYIQDYDRAIDGFLKLLDAEPDISQAQILLGASLVEVGEFDEGIARLIKGMEIQGGEHPIMIGALGYAYGLAGRRELALEQLEKLEQLSREMYVVPYYKAFIHAALGDHDRAFEQLELSYANRDMILLKLRIDPLLDPLRSDPRMDDLMRRVGLNPGPVS